jgi:hemoglobin
MVRGGPQTRSVYELAGGERTFDLLIERFYSKVAEDPVLRPLYPRDDERFRLSAEHLRLFLIQYWGGPTWYGERRGHPRLRMRHMPFSIGRAERDAWMAHMAGAVNSLDLPPQLTRALLDYFETAATAMMNRGEP